jgi:hypothetical protein
MMLKKKFHSFLLEHYYIKIKKMENYLNNNFKNNNDVLIILTITFLILFIIFCYKYNDVKKSSCPIVPSYVPFTHAQDGSATVNLSGNNVINQYWVQKPYSGNIAQTLVFPSAADIVSYLIGPLSVINIDPNGYTMIVNNLCGNTLTFDFTAAGLDTNYGGTLADNHYIIFKVTIVSAISGSESVYFDSVDTYSNY